MPFTADKDKTSLGQQAMQVRRAAEALGYKPERLTDAQHDALLNTLDDGSQSIFLAAKHLSDLRGIDTPGKAGKDLTQGDIEVVGARYNRGPELTPQQIAKNLSYGEAITRRWSTLANLLTSAPAPLEYSPVADNIVKPAESFIESWERGIRNIYGL